MVQRRKFLKYVSAGIGISISDIQVAAEPEKNTRIPHIVSEGEVIVTKQVPRQWVNHLEQAKSIAENLTQRFERNGGFVGVSYGAATDSRINGLSKTKLCVILSDSEQKREFQQRMPDRIEGVSLEFDTIAEMDPDGADDGTIANCYDMKYRPMQPGVKMAGGSIGTTGWKVTSNTGYKFLLGSYHIVSNNRCAGIYDNDVHNPNSYTDRVASGWNGSEVQDWVVCRMENGVDMSPQIIKEPYPDDTGKISKDSLQEMCCSGDELKHRGINGCESYHEIDRVGEFNNERCGGTASELIRFTNPQTEDGDSGGPHYQVLSFDGQDVYGCGAIHRGCNSNYGYAQAAYSIEDQGYYF